ncbi:TonB-dependent receptor [Sphingomonas sp. JC676]|uniref:TonB-dependent receptor n=1 Tax=Sphingomonas sp. JC676 TaxID=2768065 RepID=UPI0016581B8E|nr:TonB-dependent receptor [Sphingomonas sp. JC676]MBC9033424.1 TonB-dependent receptor [Sphingomonas sp. JC676]
MHARIARSITTRRAMMLGAVLLGGTAWPALAQTTPDTTAQAPAADDGQVTSDQDIVVSGYRASLQSSTNAKREATGFTDSIFAEDIGKFPDTNIAESFNRIPGVTISRDITGEGLQVTIRGLGTNFTRVLLNNAPIAVASTGGDGQQSTNREVDLDLFPTELFTKLEVQKSPNADRLEGGAAGTVNMRSARAFDNPGTHIVYSGQVLKNTNSDKYGYRGSLLASTTMGDFGVLLGVAGQHNEIRTTGFESVGWTNPNLNTPQSIAGSGNTPTPAQIAAAQCRAGTGCNATGGGNWTIPGTVPSNANIPGVAAGTIINQDLLLQLNPGASISQIDNGIIPRLGRTTDEYGYKERLNFIGSLEYKGETIHAYIDGMFARKRNAMQRIDMNWVGRNGAIIPVNATFDRSDCTSGCTVTKGTFYNAQFFLEYRPYFESLQYWGVNPGIEAQITDKLKLAVNGNYTKSQFHRESPTVLPITLANSGLTVNYDNTGGDFPSITSNVDLNNPANFGWPGGRVNIQDERRNTYTKGVRGDLTWGGEKLNLQVGGAYDDVSRSIRGYDNSQAWQNAVCGDKPSVFLPSPNSQPPCNGLNTATPGAGYPTYPGYGTNYTAGQTGPVTYGGSLVPTGAPLQGLLLPGPDNFITVDWNKFKAASNYDFFHDTAPEAGGANTGASGGYVRERTIGGYAEVNGNLPIGDNRLQLNAGVRWVKTLQTIGGRVTLPDPRNTPADPDGAGPLPAPTPLDGGLYPNVVNFVYTDNDYTNFLPSASAAFHIGDHAVVRAAVSRTMTRPNPSSMLPGLSFGSPSADVGTVGNSALEPYISDNIDLGFEYYTGAEGYIGFAAFRKAVTGFTVNGNVTVPFSALAQYGVTYSTLNPTQQAAIDSRGGPNAATVVLTQQVNASGTLKVNGLELNWVQPLDFLLDRYLGVKGFGFNANMTLINQSGSGAAPAVATGVSPLTYNISAYYENHGISLRMSTTFNQGNQISSANQNGITAAALFSDDYQQWDFSSSFDLNEMFGAKHLPELTVDVQNLTKASQRTYFQYENATYTLFNPGRVVMLGLRGRF